MGIGLWLFFSLISTLSAVERGTIIPLYIYPTSENAWKPLIDAYNTNPIEVWAIVNVFNGPGTSLDSSYAAAISNLKSVGINTLGYVRTNYTQRNLKKVKKDISSWKTFYSPDGIFFDEMSNQDNASFVEYYSVLDDFAKGQGFTFTVGNPGADVPLEYFDAVDTVMIYERPGFPRSNDLCSSNRYQSITDKSAVAIFPYGVETLNENAILDAKPCLGYIYVTNDDGSNPWDTLPPYLNQLFELLSR